MTTASSLHELALALDETPARVADHQTSEQINQYIAELRGALPHRAEQFGIEPEQCTRWLDELARLVPRAQNGEQTVAAAELAIGFYATAFMLGANDDDVREAAEQDALLPSLVVPASA